VSRGFFDPSRSPVPRAHAEPGAFRRKVYTVSELTALVKGAVEEKVGAVWVEGEVSNLSRPASGHVYFTLKDERAQLQAVLWRSVASRLGFTLEDGDQVLVFGRLTVYEPRGQHQIVIERVELEGLGALQRALEELRARLAKEGLFDPARKRALPFLPRAIGIVTSPSGAAIHDMLEVIWERFPRARVVLRPVRVQGEFAAAEIAQAIREFDAWGGADVLIVGRGGGSAEDLSAFNDEEVVRAVAGSRTPVVSAVGHEVDVTLTDFAADVHALTPTEAAVRVVPRLRDLLEELDSSARRAASAVGSRLDAERERVRLLERSYGLHAPHEFVARERQRLDDFASRLPAALGRGLASARERLAELSGRLGGLSPLAVLARGYTITRRAREGSRPLRDASELSPGDRITTRFARGEADSLVEKVRRTPRSRGG